MPYSRRAAVYDVEYAEERDVGFILGLVGGAAPSVLEVPCGAGRLSLRIAPRAGRLTVVDLEPEMVARTVAALAAPGPWQHGSAAGSPTCEALRLEQRFDLALIPREALQLLPPEEGRQALAAVAAMSRLAAGWWSISPPSAPSRAGRRTRTTMTRPGPTAPGPPTGPGRCRTGRNWSGNRRSTTTRPSIRFDLQYRVLGGGRAAEDWISGMRLYRYGRGWVDEARPAGMAVEAVHGDYDGSDFTGDLRRLIALYRRGPAAGR